MKTNRGRGMTPYSPDQLPESLEGRVIPITECGCWIWFGLWESGNGYSKVCYNGRAWMAHRLMYTLLVGKIPKGLVLDHVCRNRACCNPHHLEPVTTKVNTHRGGAVLYKKLLTLEAI